MDNVRGRRVVEWVKTALIALLLVSALLLGWQTRLYNDFFNAIPLFGNVANLMRGAAGPGTTESGGVSLQEAARPLTIVITNTSGGRYGVRYDTDVRNTVYNKTSIILGEALGSASVPLAIREEDWRVALSRPGVYFEYVVPIKLSILGGWLGTSLPERVRDISLRRIFVAFGEDRSRVYFQDYDSGLFFAADTASSVGKAQELEVYSSNSAQFAFETGISAAENAPYMLIMPGSEHPEVRAVAEGNAEELLSAVINAMGHSNEKSTNYVGSDGTLVCIGTQFNIRADMRGHVAYQRTDTIPPDEDTQTSSESEMIEKARVVTAATVGNTNGGAEVFFESMEASNERTRSLFFGYYIAGGRIHSGEDSYAAKVTFTDDMITEVELNFRNFSISDEYSKLLPERQALASAGGEFILIYSDTGVERLQPSWVLYN